MGKHLIFTSTQLIKSSGVLNKCVVPLGQKLERGKRQVNKKSLKIKMNCADTRKNIFSHGITLDDTFGS